MATFLPSLQFFQNDDDLMPRQHVMQTPIFPVSSIAPKQNFVYFFAVVRNRTFHEVHLSNYYVFG